jgi:hypothetical protein
MLLTRPFTVVLAAEDSGESAGTVASDMSDWSAMFGVDIGG